MRYKMEEKSFGALEIQPKILFKYRSLLAGAEGS